ncbi:uncharacterized protein B0H64DRAFT_316431 [Chaetomium fimeti]|uniref:Uncharacterized protein n=1 Tax=Chaetomium fimeti TaxID=1854472 RepID=A0AAE0HLF6_9PEZI|nr:hypothetical protein B0H64DRAFT_316431 [Chaetomium fimeti]
MVSFFGLNIGGKKKKPDEKPAQEKQPQQWKRIDQNALGEGQFFGQNANQPGVVNGSIRSVSRTGTPQPTRSASSPYANRDTHNMAVASMADLTTSGPVRSGGQASVLLRPHASEANIRTRFGTNNGSSASLAGPAPGFGARFGANNGSSTSLAGPGPGFGSRPGTASGKAKPWVNPLDVHFARDAPSGPPTPKSPYADSIQLPQTPTTDNGDTGSVFGEEADDMVDAVMASVKKREQEEKAAKRREKELERRRETARLDMERLERQKSTESTLTARGPSAPHSPLEPQQKPFEELALQGPVFRGDMDSRPSSRHGPAQAPSWHQGPPPTGPPTQCLPQPPGQGPPRQGPLGPAGECRSGRSPRPAINGPGPGPGPGPRPNGSGPQQFRSKGPSPGPQGTQSRAQGPAPNDPAEKVFRPYRPPPLQGSGPLGLMSEGLRSPSPAHNASGIKGYRAQSPALRSPAVRSPPPIEHHAAVFSSDPEAPSSRRGTPGPERQGLVPLISSLTSPSTVTSPGSIRRLSVDDEPIEPFTRPVIKNVIAKRDTLTSSTPRQHSLSMRIEELEKTLLDAQQAHPVPKLPIPEDNRTSTSSSVYSDGIKDEDDDDDDGPILSIHPAPLRIMSPPVPSHATGPGPAPGATMSPPAPIPAAIVRPQSPMRGPPRRGPLPRRPGLEEYGVSSKAVNSRGGTPTPASRSGSIDNYSSHSSPPSCTNTPQVRHPNVKRDLTQPSPAPTVDTLERARPNPVVDTGFKFDFGPGPGVIGPPTPDSTTWSLASPAGDVGSTLPPPTSDPSQAQGKSELSAKFTRSHVPAPLNLKFNFSPDAPSRDPTLGSPGGMWTPPIRSATGSTMDGRPSTSGGPGGPVSGGGLAASPSFLSKFPDLSAQGDDDPAAFMGIGMARGPSIRDVRRPKTSGARKPKLGTIDSRGTGFI